MDRKLNLKIFLIEFSAYPFMLIGIFLSIGVLDLLVLRPLGLPTPPEEMGHSTKSVLELILGIPVILLTGLLGIFTGIILWSICVKIFSLKQKIKQLLQESQNKYNARYRSMLLWGLNKISKS